MKKDTLNSSRWILGGVAALLFLGSGSLASAQVVTSYNDLAWGAGQLEGNTTKFTSPVGGSGLPSTGQLKDFVSGNDTAVTLTVTGGSFNGTSQATQGANPTAGSDAFAIFDGNLDGLGAISYINDVNDSLVLTFTSMDPTKFYDLAFFGHRGANGWDRASLVTISGQDSFSNNSSLATDNPSEPGGVLFSGPTDTSTRLPADNFNGYVARFSNINPGSDGEVVLTISFDGSAPFTGKYGSAIRLVEVGSVTGGGSGSNPDLDGDGKADLVWRNTSNGLVAVWLGDGLNAPIIGTTTAVIGGAPLVWTIAGFGDLDGDGKSDLVWRNTSNGAVAVWLGDGLNAPIIGTTTAVIGGAPLVWTIVDIRDMDGDGKADLVWRKADNGAVSVWLGDGLNAPTSTGGIGGAPLVWELEP